MTQFCIIGKPTYGSGIDEKILLFSILLWVGMFIFLIILSYVAKMEEMGLYSGFILLIQ